MEPSRRTATEGDEGGRKKLGRNCKGSSLTHPANVPIRPNHLAVLPLAHRRQCEEALVQGKLPPPQSNTTITNARQGHALCRLRGRRGKIDGQEIRMPLTKTSEPGSTECHQGIRSQQMEGDRPKGWQTGQGEPVHPPRRRLSLAKHQRRLASSMRRSILEGRFDDSLLRSPPVDPDWGADFSNSRFTL